MQGLLALRTRFAVVGQPFRTGSLISLSCCGIPNLVLHFLTVLQPAAPLLTAAWLMCISKTGPTKVVPISTVHSLTFDLAGGVSGAKSVFLILWLVESL